MKKILVSLVAMMFLVSGSAFAIAIDGGTYGGTDVGGVDTLLASTELSNSGQQTETDWVNSIIDPETA
ncbi:MAG: hypothetical protein K0A94_12740, partial [Desulfuromonadales bacterium]|nr:hypothetical protein [Desulfuromonadales bacterium]